MKHRGNDSYESTNGKNICFYLPQEENGCLSNWYSSAFTLDGVRFSSAEQYLMYQKSAAFHDAARVEAILAAEDPATIKKLGRLVTPFDKQIWEGIRQVVAYRGLYAKFSQSEALREQLLATGDALLAECSRNDWIWGVGWGMTDPERLKRSKWMCINLLGFSLMQVRKALQRAR